MDDANNPQGTGEEFIADDTVDEEIAISDTEDGTTENDDIMEEDSSEDDFHDDDDSEEEAEEEAASELVKVEYEGETYEVPPQLEKALMLQADYTRKTQEVAESRKELEGQQAQFQQAVQMQMANLQDYGELVAANQQLEQFSQIDWDSIQDPMEAMRLDRAARDAQERVNQAQTRIQQFQAKSFHEQQADLAKQKEQGEAVLKRDIPGWTPEVAKATAEFAIDAYGFTPQEMSSVYDARQVKVIADAMKWRKLQEKQKAKPKPKPKPVTAVTQVKGKRTSAPKGLDDSLSADEWVKRRNAQLAKRRAS